MGRGQKRKPDNVLRRKYAFRPNKPIKVTVKTRRRVADCARIRKVHRSDFTLQGHPQKCPQEIFGEEEKPQGGLGGQASLVCLPASARFDEVRAQDAPFPRLARYFLTAIKDLPPIYGLNTSGIVTLPSACKWFSTKAMSMRGGATTVLFRV